MAIYPSDNIYPQSYLVPNGSLYAHFIFDRTYDDVLLVAKLNEKMLDGSISDKEKELWRKDLKGALNRSDLRRLENAYDYLKSDAKMDLRATPMRVFGRITIPTESYFQGIVDNTNKLIDSAYVMQPFSSPALPLNTYQKWNDIELVTYTALNTYIRNKRAFSYAGDDMFMDNNSLI